MDSMLVFMMLWGVWLITPVLVDGADAISRLIVVKRQAKDDHDRIADDLLPTITIIVPAHNEAEVIDRCLTSVKAQDYPHDKLEVIVIDDGSTDETAVIADSHAEDGMEPRDLLIRGERICVGQFEGRFLVMRNDHGGKAHALNTGIAASEGELIINIDSDVVLAPGTVRRTAEQFVRDPDLGAATGDIEVDWELIEERDAEGRAVLDANGLPRSRHLTPWQRLLSQAQFLEYLASFRLGRHAQSTRDTVYTLAGAFSAYRRSAIADFSAYSNRTVSEDTDLTWMLHRLGHRVGFVPRARVLLEPCLSWDELYAQRVRWARGQLEVSAVNSDLLGDKSLRGLQRVSLVKMLLLDHTMAFPRLLWVPLMLLFPLLGYPLWLVSVALLGMYALYLGMEIVNTFAIFWIAEDDTQHRIERSTFTLVAMPFYRFVIFYFRVSGFLAALMEEQQWTVTGHMSRITERFDLARLRSIRLLTLAVRGSTFVWTVSLRLLVTFVAPVLIGVAVAGTWVLSLMRRNS